MVWHYIIIPSGRLPDAREKIIARATEDRATVHLNRDGSDLLIFCESVELADLQRSRCSEGHSPSRTLASIHFPKGYRRLLRINQECSEDSLAKLIPFVQWILEECAPCQIIDEDEAKEITDRVAQQPEWLYR